MYSLGRLVLTRPRLVREYLAYYRRIRLRHAGLAVLTIVAVLASAVALAYVPAPLDSWIWWSWLLAAGQAGGNIVALPLSQWWLAVIFVPLLVLALPLLAYVEERIFRAGTRSWFEAFWRSLIFGSVHIIVGVPLGLALVGLGIAGLSFSAEYFRGRSRARQALATAEPGNPFAEIDPDRRERLAVEAGIRDSTTLHLAYNVLAFALLIGVQALLIAVPDLLE
jgi:hypothetical protein